MKLQFLGAVIICLSMPAKSEQIKASLTAPYSVPDAYVPTSYGQSIGEAVSIWWEKYKKYWGVSPHGSLECSYIVTSLNSGNLVGHVDLTGNCGGGDPIYATYSCPDGTINLNNGVCELRFVAAVPPDSPPTSCPVGNPVDTASGAKFQQEIDIPLGGSGQIEFTRTYSNANKKKGGYWSLLSHSFIS